ncbi:transposase [Pollutibacter soli]|uniref:transposase n=1 Tax=Pollutibacter soli TaxID=3034157 RepID=UPI00301382A0
MKFKSTTFQKFNQIFKTDDDCRTYLYSIKWQNGYCCRKCNNDLSYKGETKFHQRCRLCDYDESVTANTVFHKIKFPLLKAFGIALLVMSRKKGISTLEISRSFGIRQTTAWLFKRKLQEAIKSGEEFIPPGDLYKVEIQIGGAEVESKSRFRGSEKRAVISLVFNGRKIVHGSAQVVDRGNASGSSNDTGSKLRIHEKEFHSKKKKQKRNQSASDIVVLNLKNWLRGIHHHCSGHFVSGYLDEFFFRFNNRNHLKSIFHLVVEKMISGRPYFYKPMAAK